MTSITKENTKTSGRAKKLLATASLAAITVLSTAVPAMAALSPADLPHNIVIFPQRDFITLEGYEARAGETVNVTVKRGDEITGQARGVIGLGDPSLEINHPGGLCWGQGSADFRKVTPNIKPGDVVTATFADGHEDSATTLSPEVTSFNAPASDPNRLVVRGTYGPDVNTAFMEQRVINPDMDDTRIGRRDVRAPARPGPYTSQLVTNGGNFTATYTFGNDGTPNNGTNTMRDLAAEGQMRAMGWEQEDADGERIGLTISEFGEVGGPGFGGCPQGPEVQAPDAPTGVSGTGGEGFVTAKWTASHVIPDAPSVLRYLVTAVRADGLETSVRVQNPATTGTVPGLTPGNYTVEVTAISSAGRSAVGTSETVTVTGAPAPNAPTIGATAQGAASASSISATVNWREAATQPTGVVIEGYRITAYNAANDARIKSVFVDAPTSSKEVTFTSAQTPSGTSVYFKVQAIDSNGTLSAQSAQSSSVAPR